MTCCIGMVCTDGILLASDSLVQGNNKAHLPDIKGFEWHGLEVLYAGDLAYAQKLQQLRSTKYKYGEVLGLQQLVWEYPPAKKDDAEFLAVDRDWCLYTVDKWGAAVPAPRFAVIGSDMGGACMHMLEKRERTMSQAKRAVARVLRAVAIMDSGVAEPFRYKELPFV